MCQRRTCDQHAGVDEPGMRRRVGPGSRGWPGSHVLVATTVSSSPVIGRGASMRPLARNDQPIRRNVAESHAAGRRLHAMAQELSPVVAVHQLVVHVEGMHEPYVSSLSEFCQRFAPTIEELKRTAHGQWVLFAPPNGLRRPSWPKLSARDTPASWGGAAGPPSRLADSDATTWAQVGGLTPGRRPGGSSTSCRHRRGQGAYARWGAR